MTMKVKDEMNVNQRTAKTAGYLYLAIIVGSVLGGMLTGLWLEAGQAGDMMSMPEGIYRAGFSIYLFIYLVELVTAVVLYQLLKPVNKTLALLAAFFRAAEAIILGFNMLNQFQAFQLLNGTGFAVMFQPGQAQAMAAMFLSAHRSGYLISQLFFAIHCFFLGYLIYQSGYFPRLIGTILMAACFGYLIESLAYFVLPNYAAVEGITSLISAIPAVLAEFALTYWLLFKGKTIEETYQQFAAVN